MILNFTVVSIVIRLRAGSLWVRLRAETCDGSLVRNLQTSSGADPLSCWMDTGHLLGGAWSWSLIPSKVDVKKNEWSHTSASPVCFHGVHRDDVICTYSRHSSALDYLQDRRLIPLSLLFSPSSVPYVPQNFINAAILVWVYRFSSSQSYLRLSLSISPSPWPSHSSPSLCTVRIMPVEPIFPD